MDDKRPTYEEAVKRLEEIVKKLESGAAPLDESIALVSEGAELVKTCTAILDEAEQKVKILTESEKSE